MSIIDALRRASEALCKHADDLQALSDEVHIAGGEMSDEQWERAATLDRRAYQAVQRLDGALMSWRWDRQKQLDNASRGKEK